MKKLLYSIVLGLIVNLLPGPFSAISANRVDVTLYPEISEKYNAVKVGGEFRIMYCNAADTMKIIANDKVIETIECVVEDGTLTVRYKKGKGAKAILGGKSPVVYIPADPRIEKMILSGTTRMTCLVPIVCKNFSLELSGTARAVGEVKTTELSIRCAGTVNVTLTGSSDAVDIRIDGASRVAMGEGFESKNANIDINGAGVVRINCKGKLTGEISGVSVVKYLGDPEVSIITNGLASVTAADK